METEEKKAPAPANKRRRIWTVLGIIVLLLVVLTALLPAIASTGPIRRLIVDGINKSMTGKLTIESWSLGWFFGNRVNGLEYSDPQGITIRAREITMSKGLISLLGRTKSFGDLAVESPEAVITAEMQSEVRPDSASTSKTAPGKDRGAGQPGARETKSSETRAKGKAAPAETAVLPLDITGKIALKNGRASIKIPNSKRHYEFDGLNATITLESLNKPVTFQASLLQVMEKGTFRVSGSAKLFEKGRLDLAGLAADIDLEASGLEMRPFAALASVFMKSPDVKGVLDSRITAKINGMDKINAEGFVHMTNIVMSGAFLSTDKPSIETIRLDFDVARQDKNLKIRNFKLYAPFLTAAAEGELADKNGRFSAGSVAINAKVDLARLAHEFPATLRIARGVAVSRGTLFAKLDVDSSGDLATCSTSMKISGVEASREGQTLSLDSPVLLDGKAIISKEGVHLNNLQLTSAFAKVDGSGDMKDMKITLDADIAAAMKEARKFLDLGKFGAAGTLHVVSHIQSASDQERNIETLISAADLRISGITPTPFALESLKAGMSVFMKTDKDGNLLEYSNARLDLESSAISAKGAIARIKPGKGAEDMQVKDAAVRVRADVNKLAALARSMGMCGQDLDGGGDITIAMTAAMENGVIAVNPVSAAIADFKISMEGGKEIREPKGTVSGSVEADLNTRTIKVSGLKAELSSGTFDAAQIRIADWNTRPPAVECECKARLNVERLLAQFPGFLSVQEGSSVAGGLETDFSIEPGAKTRTIKLDALCRDLAVKSASGAAFSEPSGRIVLLAEQNYASGDLSLKNVRITSSTLNLSAAGSYTGVQSDKNMTLAGTMECDFKRVSEILASLKGMKIEMEGREEKKFSLKTSFANPDLRSVLRKTQGQAGLRLARCKAFGLQVSDLSLSAAADGGIVKCDIDTKVNEGRLKIVPQINALEDRVFLTVPENSKIIRGLQLTDDMMADLLAKIHPVLRGSSVVGGRTDLTLQKCVVPLDNQWTNSMDIRGDLAFSDVVVKPGGIIGTLLEITSLGAEPVNITNQVISFACANGRIETSPLTIRRGDLKIVFSGYALMDGRLKFVAEIPVTEGMVDAKYYKHLKNLTIKLPIEGTASKPELLKAFTKAIGNLVKDAALNALQEDGLNILEDIFSKKKKTKPEPAVEGDTK